MADDARSRLRAFLDMMLRRQREQPKVEPSHFARAEDQQEQARPVKVASTPRKFVSPGLSDQARPAVQKPAPAAPNFNKQALSAEIKDRQSYDARFRSETARAAATEAREEARFLREKADEKFYKAQERFEDVVATYGVNRSMSDEGALDANQRLQAAREEHKRTIADVNRQLVFAESEAMTLNGPIKVPFGPIPAERQIEYQPISARELAQKFYTPWHDREHWMREFFDAVQNGTEMPAETVQPEAMTPTVRPEVDWPAQFRRAAERMPPAGTGHGIGV